MERAVCRALRQRILGAEAVIKRDESRYFDGDEIAFEMTIRIDGQPADSLAAPTRAGGSHCTGYAAGLTTPVQRNERA